ncbi:hypothetical protein [Streptomyces sp. JJ36]|uniref:hypothetical protein n=1 Tax=Streptomyces sp. JJ36 TaxID=2736645 RepID=UPI001F24C928|nr:hypothetical protein [Streptomyces sp. JJ36]
MNPRYSEPREEPPSRRTALVVHTVADVAAALLGLWIVLSLLDANQGNAFVQFVRETASWLAGWSQDIFTMENPHVRLALNYGLPAVVSLFVGHGIAARIRRG